jgi:hypothetical protein
MTSGSNDFSLLFKNDRSLAPGKAGKRMVNIDDLIFVKRNQIWCYDLHVTGQNNKVDLVFVIQFVAFLLILCCP